MDKQILVRHHPQAKQREFLCKGYLYVASSLILLTSIVALLTACQDWALLGHKDVVFEVPVRTVLLASGLLAAAAAVWLLVMRDLNGQSIILLWLGVNHVVYRVALAWLNASMPLTVLRVLGMKVGIRAQTLDVWWKGFMVFLVVGSVLVLVGEWRRRKRLRAEAFLAEWQAQRNPQNH